tara:strand:+ start:3448 stop:3819 length:372 start_codon:yes stop_codon:yes gene_type:complete
MTDTVDNNRINVKVVERSSKEIWTYERQTELLASRLKELEEAGIYCVSGQNIIRPEHRAEYRQLKDAISNLKQKAAGIVDPKPQPDPTSILSRPKRPNRKSVSDEERKRLVAEFRRLREEAGL